MDEQLEIARRWGVARELGAALRVRGALAGDERGIELLTQAVATLDPSPARLELARALVDLGVAIRHRGKRSEARVQLERGADLARRCGATALGERALAELRILGGRPRRLAFSGIESLTASEGRVAGMAAEGLSNREIAQALFLTMKTVESHLARAYRKLGVQGRPGLLEALAGER